MELSRQTKTKAVSPDKKTAGKKTREVIKIPRHHETTVSRYHETTVSSMVEDIRRAVKQVGKEAATHRFTPEEKRAVADLIYTYNRHGHKTSENEITRIAINWLLLDYRDNGRESVLDKVIKALKE